VSPEVRKFLTGMEKAGQLAAKTLNYLCDQTRPGMSTIDLDELAVDYVRSAGAVAAPLNYNGFPKSICTSVNDVICHGVPDNRILKNGDILNIDVTTILDGFHGDTSRTILLGDVSKEALEITECAKEAMEKGISILGPGVTKGDIGFVINKVATKRGCYVVREIGGHGIGTVFHTDPFVPSYGKKGRGYALKPWQCITIEPMVNLTDSPIVEHPIPHSTIKYYSTGDKCLSAQFEHTVLVTDTGYEIMTLVD